MEDLARHDHSMGGRFGDGEGTIFRRLHSDKRRESGSLIVGGHNLEFAGNPNTHGGKGLFVLKGPVPSR